MDKAQRYKEESKIAFNRLANHFDSNYYGHHGRKLHGVIIKIMDGLAYESVLDVGCGTGSLLSEVMKRKKVAVAGLDISDKMLGIAKKRLGENADLRNGDSEHLPWKGNSFDIVTCTDSFHHYPNPAAVLKEMRRVLKLDGKVIIADPWAPSPFRQVGNLLAPLGREGDVRVYSMQEMKKLLEESGLALISWERAGISAFVLVAKPA